MKIQDIAFLIVFVAFLFVRNPKWFVAAGLLSLFLSIPLFSFWIFFTAERLVWYSGAFFLASIIFILYNLKNENRN